MPVVVGRGSTPAINHEQDRRTGKLSDLARFGGVSMVTHMGIDPNTGWVRLELKPRNSPLPPDVYLISPATIRTAKAWTE